MPEARTHLQTYLDTETTKRHLGRRVARDCMEAAVLSRNNKESACVPDFEEHAMVGENVRQKCISSAYKFDHGMEYADNYKILGASEEHQIDPSGRGRLLSELEARELTSSQGREAALYEAERRREMELDLKRQEMLKAKDAQLKNKQKKNKREQKDGKKKSRKPKSNALSADNPVDLLLRNVKEKSENPGNAEASEASIANDVISGQSTERPQSGFNFNALKRALEEDIPAVDDIIEEQEALCASISVPSVPLRSQLAARLAASDQAQREVPVGGSQARQERPTVMAWNSATAMRGVGFRSKQRQS